MVIISEYDRRELNSLGIGQVSLNMEKKLVRYMGIKRAGSVSLDVNGIVHRILRKSLAGSTSAKQLRSSTFHMREFEECLVFGFFVKLESRGYQITPVGIRACEMLNQAYDAFKSRAEWIPVEVSQYWFDYFMSHTW